MNFLSDFKQGSKVSFIENTNFYGIKNQSIDNYGYVNEIIDNDLIICCTNPPVNRGRLYRKNYKQVKLNSIQK